MPLIFQKRVRERKRRSNFVDLAQYFSNYHDETNTITRLTYNFISHNKYNFTMLGALLYKC